MPAYLLEQIEPWKNSGEDTEEKRKQLAKEIAGYDGPGKPYLKRIQTFMENHEIWCLKDLDYEWRLTFAEEIRKKINPRIISWHLRAFDHLKQYDMRRSERFQIERSISGYPYENSLLFLPYHPIQELVKRMDTSQERPDWVWDFSLPAPEQMKRQIYTCLVYFLKEDGDLKLLRTRLSGLQLFYRFCAEQQVPDIEQLGIEQAEEYRRTTKEEKNQRAFRILDVCRKILFLQAEEINWDARVWYLERLHLEPERIDPANAIVSFSFAEVSHDRNRELLQKYMRYGLGLTSVTIRYLQGEMLEIRAILQEMKEDACEVTEIQMEGYIKGLQAKKIKPESFNRKIMSLLHFYNFLLAKRYIQRIPLHADYYLKKTLPVHHDRSVPQEAAEEMLDNLHRFPEHLRLMYLHLWGIGLRISEVCRLKGDAYYIQGRDAWIQVYQTKMKNYKRIPIPEAIYRLMRVYIKRHGIAADAYVFPNKNGGAYRSATFRKQMTEWCETLEIQGGEYLFQAHDYRHSVATYFYGNGVSIQGVRDYLGHTYEEMTQQYIDYMPKKIDNASKEFFEKKGNSLAARLKGGETQ